MDYRTLGRSGCAVSTLALGTMTFGAEADETSSHAQLDAFAEAGGNLVDTADVYSAGASEKIVGSWLSSRPADVRDAVVLATKGRFPMGDNVNDRRARQARTWDVVDALREIAEGRGASMPQVALSWLTNRPGVTSVILGARTREQLRDNLSAAGMHLTAEETNTLEAASDPGPADYPYGGAGIDQRNRRLDGPP